jgi:1-acyl-sn-glycerol-3-phosphate acyltransferase
LWPKGRLGKRPGTITVSIGAPISAKGHDMQRLINEVEAWIEDEVARLGNPLDPSVDTRA